MKETEIEKIIILLNKYDLSSIKFKNKNFFLEINKTSKQKNQIINNTSNEDNIKIIKAPLVGVFYTSETPNKKAFVKEGDKINKGDTICIIESMKTLHKIKSTYTGVVEKILLKNETHVEYNQDLFMIKHV